MLFYLLYTVNVVSRLFVVFMSWLSGKWVSPLGINRAVQSILQCIINIINCPCEIFIVLSDSHSSYIIKVSEQAVLKTNVGPRRILITWQDCKCCFITFHIIISDVLSPSLQNAEANFNCGLYNYKLSSIYPKYLFLNVFLNHLYMELNWN